MSKFQRIFKNLREQKNMTQEELAKALGVSKSTIGMYERGDREPNFEKLEVIADYFNVNMSDLIDSKNTASEMLPASKIGVRSHTVAERLNEVMTIRGLKQADVLNLAKPYCDKYKIKLSKNDLSQYVSGKVEPRQRKIAILGMALSVSELWLMGYDVPMEKTYDYSSIVSNSGADEIYQIFASLSPDNRAKLVELGHLYLTAQYNTEEKK